MKLDTIQSKILRHLIKNEWSEIHQLLDIPATVALDQCRVFKGVNENFQEQIALRPDKGDTLITELTRIQRSIIKALQAASQIHGMTEKESEKFLASGQLPI